MIQTLDLNGTWKVRPCDGHRGKPEFANRDTVDATRYIDAIVPGEAHLDAWREGWIEDPYVGTNALGARWVEEFIWSYRREFEAPVGALRGRAWLVFDCLDYAATILLNGVQIGTHHNVYYPCRVDVTGKLREGRNLITVHLDSGLHETAHKDGRGYNLDSDKYQPKRVFLRKPQCQFSWDWSIRFVNVGITGPVRLEWTHEPARLDQLVALVDLSEDLARGHVRIRQFVEGLAAEVATGQLTVELVEAGRTFTAAVEVKPGLHPCETAFDIDNPKLWWPAGHGEQNLYTLRVTLTIDARPIGERTREIGFRRVRINQDPHPEAGKFFIIEVNGKKIFAKGGNFVPADMIFTRIDRERYVALVDRALEANFNFLRIWGGGMYEADDFYELCDEKGILVWQEFIFACGRYPSTEPEFMENVRTEARWNIRRLASHPSLIIWCGNNEMEWASWDWGWDKYGKIMPDHALFHITLPRLMAEEDPGRFYWPSSPYSPEGTHPNDDHIGDQHPWQVGFADTDFRGYRKRICRFPNEGGTLGPTALPTMLACLPPNQRRIGSFAWQWHDNTVDSWGEPSYPNEMLVQWLGKHPYNMTIEDFAYWGGLIQGEGLREYADNFHRRMFSSSSAIFWMYNDTWPAVRSWTIIDYYLRRTPCFHPVRRAMAPINIVVAEEGDEVVIFGINETSSPVNAQLRFGIFDLAGGCPIDRKLPTSLPPNASTRLAAFRRSEWTSPDHSAAFAMLARDGQLLARNRLFLPFFKDLKWSAPQLEVRVENGRAVFSSSTFVWGVCLDLDGERALADNFFDVYPGIAYSIPWAGGEKPTVIRTGNLVP